MQFHTDLHSNLLYNFFVLDTKSTHISIVYTLGDYVMKCLKPGSETGQLWLVVPLKF